MAQFYEMPAISPTMEVGTLVEWKIAEGQSFQSTAVVAEVGTDKANMEAEIFDPGVMIKHLVAEGDEVPPGFPIAIWGASTDEDIAPLVSKFTDLKAALDAGDSAPPAESAPSASSNGAATASPAAKPVETATGTVERRWQARSIHNDFYDPPGDIRFGVTSAGSPRVAASPLARKVAADLGVDLARVQGTGPGGRIVRADVESAPREGTASVATRADERKRNSPMRKTIAKRLLQSHQDIPTFFLTATFDMAAFVELRGELKARLPDVKISYNDILVAAVARALVTHPEVNAQWDGDAIVHKGPVDIGIAVAIDQGLITPVVRGVDRLSLSEIGSQVRELAKRARDQRLVPEEYTGGTFTISNLGMMDIEHFTAIINPPEAAILAVGSIREVPVVVDGSFELGYRMKVTMTCDHRVIDGAVGATFLQTLRSYVESPWLLLA